MTYRNYFLSLIIFNLIFITSCYNIRFDNLEYTNLIKFKYQITDIRNNCDNKDISNELEIANSNLSVMIEYATHRNERPQIYKSILELQKMFDQLYTKTKHQNNNTIYCRIKTQNIIDGTNILLNGMGNLD